MPRERRNVMIVELKKVTLNIQPGFTAGISHEPQECPYCHRMTHFFENRGGVTRCTSCPAPQPVGVQ